MTPEKPLFNKSLGRSLWVKIASPQGTAHQPTKVQIGQCVNPLLSIQPFGVRIPPKPLTESKKRFPFFPHHLARFPLQPPQDPAESESAIAVPHPQITAHDSTHHRSRKRPNCVLCDLR
ncbi:hypothetical protein KUV47_18185 [Vannielia litorea]|uniref:hypothetical protein n=1 Tax=Vannielia litorea TaxID=1217970 RepID=UPI001C956FE1|nr:hypothetical protein [Vannielia litorea]MBY6155157.1 hypothetical protein [Vannielia litorea]